MKIEFVVPNLHQNEILMLKYHYSIGVDVEGNTCEQEKLFNTLRLAGKIAEQHVCLGQINAFELLVNENDVAKSISLLQKRLGNRLQS